jgi:hypothetical protein
VMFSQKSTSITNSLTKNNAFGQVKSSHLFTKIPMSEKEQIRHKNTTDETRRPTTRPFASASYSPISCYNASTNTINHPSQYNHHHRQLRDNQNDQSMPPPSIHHNHPPPTHPRPSRFLLPPPRTHTSLLPSRIGTRS